MRRWSKGAVFFLEHEGRRMRVRPVLAEGCRAHDPHVWNVREMAENGVEMGRLGSFGGLGEAIDYAGKLLTGRAFV